MNSEIGRQAADFNNLIITYPLDDVLEVNFNFLLTNDAFLSPNHKTLFDFTLAYPWNVQIHFNYSGTGFKSLFYGNFFKHASLE